MKESAILRSIADRRQALATARAVAKRNGLRLVLEREEGLSVLSFADFIEPECLGPAWVFRETSDTETDLLLRLFLTATLEEPSPRHVVIRFELALHFARLLAKKGKRVADVLANALDESDWSSLGVLARRQLLLAGLAALPESGRRIVELLDVVPEDFRDGLFLACWFDRTPVVQRKLLSKFDEWTKDPAWDGGSGEGGWLYRFLAKWVAKNAFSLRCLEGLFRWKLARDFRTMT